MGDISEHISISEAACNCGCGFATADFRLVTTLEKLCHHLLQANPVPGKKVARIIAHFNSWCRCASYDKQVQLQYRPEHWRPSGRRSEHLRGWATDVWFQYKFDDGTRQKVSDDRVATILEEWFPDSCGIGRYINRTHLDMRLYKARWDNRQ